MCTMIDNVATAATFMWTREPIPRALPGFTLSMNRIKSTSRLLVPRLVLPRKARILSNICVRRNHSPYISSLCTNSPCISSHQ